MSVDVARLGRTAARTLATASLVLAGMVLVPSATKLAPTAQAAAGDTCWSSNNGFKREIKSFGMTNVSYDAEFHWCATNGIVDGFVVDKTYAVAEQAARNAYLGISPYNPLVWGPTYQIYIDVTAEKTVTGGTLGYGGSSVTAAPTAYHDRWEINLHGDGKFDAELNGGR